MKYTTKELNNIAGTHDPFHCHLEDCDICIRFWTYAKGLREQSKEEDKQITRPKRLVPKRSKTSLSLISDVSDKTVKALVKNFSVELTDAIEKGYTIREIAFQLDCEDVVIVKALDYLHLHEKTRSQLNIEAYRLKLIELVSEGYSVKAIAKYLGKKSSAGISYYLSKYDLPRPNISKCILDEVEFYDGNVLKRRYFDNQGNELVLSKKG